LYPPHECKQNSYSTQFMNNVDGSKSIFWWTMNSSQIDNFNYFKIFFPYFLQIKMWNYSGSSYFHKILHFSSSLTLWFCFLGYLLNKGIYIKQFFHINFFSNYKVLPPNEYNEKCYKKQIIILAMTPSLEKICTTYCEVKKLYVEEFSQEFGNFSLRTPS